MTTTTTTTSLMSLMGANLVEYSNALSDEQENAEFIWASEKIKLLVKILKELPNCDRVADIGCRTGGQAAYYRDQAGIREMHGFEIGAAPLAEAAKKGIIGHEWISGVSPCPIEDDYFDAIVVGDLIEHLMDTDVFLEEIRRVIRPGGYLIVTTPNLSWWWNRLRFVMGKVPAGMGSVSANHALDEAIDRKHLRVSISSEWAYLFEQYRLEVISILGYHYPTFLKFPFNFIDKMFTKIPTLSNSCLFLLRKPE